MKAVILAGGYGKRLMPLTATLPKPLVEVGGKPIIEWQIMWLKSLGINSFVLLVGHLKNKLIEHMGKKAAELGVAVEYSEEPEPMGTAGALMNAKKLLAEEKEFIMLNGDNITNIHIGSLHINGSIASIALVPLRSTYGIVKTEGEKVISFDEKPLIKDYWMNAGVYMMSHEIFRYLPARGNLENTTFTALTKEGRLGAVKFPEAYFKGVDSIKDIDEVSHDLLSGIIYG
jgi:NDP-sugar pyrophosphorylase family protein